MIWLPESEKSRRIENTLARFHKIHERDGRTDRHRMTT